MSAVRPLDIKLIRDLRRLWAQVLAIALVMAAGVTTLVLGNGAYQSLAETRASYYAASDFADLFVSLTRAPKALVPDIAAIDGVAAVMQRITKIALLDFDDQPEPASALLVSLPADRSQTLNRLTLRRGSLPDPAADNEAVVNESFAKAHRLEPGSTFRVLINGVRRSLRVTGIALSPEFIYALGPGDLMPDDRRFGIVWMPEKALAAAYDLTGAFSNLLIKLVPGASAAHVTEQVDRLLARYGGEGAYGRKDQQSHAFLDAELNQLNAMSRVLPPIFLVVAAFLVNMTLSRLIALEREQIGLLKALGYSSWAIARHYIAFVSLIAAIGIVIGMIAGVWLGNGMTRLYARFFHFPFLVFSRDPSVYAIAATVTLGAAVAGAAKAVSDVAWLPPAVAMAPPPPPAYRKILPAALDLGGWVSQSAVMVSRHLTHWPMRSLSSVLGVAFAVAILAGSLASFGAINFMIDFTFQRAERQDASITFAVARPLSALFSINHMPGILRAEPFRAVPAKVRFGHIERRLALTAKPRNADLSRLMTADLRPVAIPEAGVVLSRALADILGVKRGERVEVEQLDGERRTLLLPVSGIVDSYIGLSAVMDLEALNHALGEGAMISGAHVSFDPGQRDELFATLKTTPTTSFVALEREAMAIFRKTVVENITTMVTTYTVLAAIIAFGVVYNFARIALSEQGRELASLRVLGFSRAEVSRLLLTELGLVVLVAQPLGWLIGAGIWYGLVRAFANELYRMPFILNRDVFAYASLISILAAAASGLAVRRRIDRLDMIAVLKTRE